MSADVDIKLYADSFDRYMQDLVKARGQHAQAKLNAAINEIEAYMRETKKHVPVGVSPTQVFLSKTARGTVERDLASTYRVAQQNLEHVTSGAYYRSEAPIQRKVWDHFHGTSAAAQASRDRWNYQKETQGTPMTFSAAVKRLLPQDVTPGLARAYKKEAAGSWKIPLAVGYITLTLTPQGQIAVKAVWKDERYRNRSLDTQVPVFDLGNSWNSARSMQEAVSDWIRSFRGSGQDETLASVMHQLPDTPEGMANLHFRLANALGHVADDRAVEYPRTPEGRAMPFLGEGSGYVYAVGIDTIRHIGDHTTRKERVTKIGYRVQIRVDSLNPAAAVYAELEPTASEMVANNRVKAIADALAAPPSSFDAVLESIRNYGYRLLQSDYTKTDAAQASAEKALTSWADSIQSAAIESSELPSYWEHPVEDPGTTVEIQLYSEVPYGSRVKTPVTSAVIEVKIWSYDYKMEATAIRGGIPLVSFTSVLPQDDDAIYEWSRDLRYTDVKDTKDLARDLEMYREELIAIAKDAKISSLHTPYTDYLDIQRKIQALITPPAFALPLVPRKEIPKAPDLTPFPTQLSDPLIRRLFLNNVLTTVWGSFEPERVLSGVESDAGVIASVRGALELFWKDGEYANWKDLERELSDFSKWLQRYAEAFPEYKVTPAHVEREVRFALERLQEERDYNAKDVYEQGKAELQSTLAEVFNDLMLIDTHTHRIPDIRAGILTAIGWLNPKAAIAQGGQDEIDNARGGDDLDKEQVASVIAELSKAFKRDVQEAIRRYNEASGDDLSLAVGGFVDTRSGSLFGGAYAPPKVEEATPRPLFIRKETPVEEGAKVTKAKSALIEITKSKESTANRRKYFTVTRAGEQRTYGTDLIQPEVTIHQLLPGQDIWQILVHGGYKGTRTLNHEMARGTKKAMIALAQEYLSMLPPGAAGGREHAKRWHGENPRGWKP